MDSMRIGPVDAETKKAGVTGLWEYRELARWMLVNLLHVLADEAGHLEHGDLCLAEDFLQLG
ncbi:MAG: hypothetical protein V4684_12890, partial [Pseudomonadota bacterium]